MNMLITFCANELRVKYSIDDRGNPYIESVVDPSNDGFDWVNHLSDATILQIENIVDKELHDDRVRGQSELRRAA